MITKIGLLAAAALTTAMSAPAHAWGFRGGIVRGGYVRPVRPVVYGGYGGYGVGVYAPGVYAPSVYAPQVVSAPYGYDYNYGVGPVYSGWQRPYYGAGYGHVGYGGGYGHVGYGHGGYGHGAWGGHGRR